MSTVPASTDEIARRDSQQLRRGQLGVLGIAFFVFSAAAPLTAMAGGAPVAMVFGNGPGLPLAYVLVATGLLIFSVGYTTMARHHTSAGGFYSYTTRGLGQMAGGAAAFVALLGYNGMQIGLHGLFGAVTAGLITDYTGLNVPWWVCSLVAIVVIGILGYRQVDLSMKVLGVLVAVEFLIVFILDIAILVKGGEGGTAPLSFEPFTPAALLSGSLAQALLFNAAAFIGFESTTIYSEEARDPRRTVPRATFVAVATIGIFYTFTTWLMVNGQGAATLVDHLNSLKPDPTVFLFELGTIYLGDFLTNVMTVLFVTSLFAALLAFHNAVARYFFSLGREGLLPERVGRTHDVHLSPHIGSVSQSVIAAVIIAVFALAKQDPVLALFTWLTQLGTLAILALMALVSLAVIMFFRRNRGLENNLWATLIAPALGTLAMAVVTIYAATQFGVLIGDPNSPLAWGLPALILVAAVAGLISSSMLRSRNPLLYAAMGRHRGDD